MASWLIGIDESGRFNTLDSSDRSYVCGVVLRDNSIDEVERLFQNVCHSLKIEFCKNKDSRQKPAELLEFFHAGVQSADLRDSILNEILVHEHGLIRQVILSRGRPYVAVNPQQWWVTATLGVIKKFFDSNDVQKTDDVRIVIDTRAYLCLGLLQTSPEEIVDEFAQILQDENIDNTEKVDVLKKRINILLNAQTVRQNKESLEMELYKESLSRDLQQELERNFSNCCNSCTVEFLSARNNPLPALADQMANLNHPKNVVLSRRPVSEKDLRKRVTGIFAAPLNTSLGKNVAALFEDGKIQEACDALLSCVFDQSENVHNYDQIDLLPKILSAAGSDHGIWKSILNSCMLSLENRGNDGYAIKHVSIILPYLKEFYGQIPKEMIRLYRYVVVEHGAHVGILDQGTLDEVDRSFEIPDEGYVNNLARWNDYVEYRAFKAQFCFDGYDFDSVNLDDLIETQKAIDKIKFPFNRKSADSVAKDENYAMIYGTLGQAEAFRGNLDKAIEYFKMDLSRATALSKCKPASYLTVVYHRKKNFQEAQRYFEIQVKKPLAEFSVKDADQWTLLNYLRLIALGHELGLSSVMPTLPENRQWQHAGDYPGPLLSKWGSFIRYREGKVDDALNLLNDAVQNLSSGGTWYTIIALKLPVIAMQIVIAKETSSENLPKIQKAFRRLLGKIIVEFQNFEKYVTANQQLFDDAERGNISLWDAAMLLPFNYS